MYKMGKEIVTFDNIEVKKHKFYQHKSPILKHDENIDRIVDLTWFLLVKKSLKYFTRFNLNILFYTKMVLKPVVPFCIMLPKITAYRRDFDETAFFDKR